MKAVRRRKISYRDVIKIVSQNVYYLLVISASTIIKADSARRGDTLGLFTQALS